MLKELKEKHDKYIKLLEDKGEALLKYKCPDCGEELKALAPPINEVWDSSVICYSCESVLFSIFHHEKVETRIIGRVKLQE
ncbi:hypothetical protein CBW53_02930 [Yersinia frederiksenii]|nr:hypothetical protein CBW53_02930 [Yersinia frederiksenii]